MLDILMSLRGLRDEDILNGIRDHSLVDRYIEMIEENRAWGGNVELGIMSRILDVQFQLIASLGLLRRSCNNSLYIKGLRVY
jgi:hypothetical protein